MLAARIVFTNQFTYLFLVWNLFLAWIPLGLALSISYIYEFYDKSLFKKFTIFTLGCIWIISYPNAPYMLTDYIHINGIDFYNTSGGYSVAFITWYDFIMNSLCL